MKGLNNRQKTVVHSRETVQKYLVQQKSVRKGKGQIQRQTGGKGFAPRGK